MLEWLREHQALMWSLGAASVVMFIASLFLAPAIIVRIRADYFAHEHRPRSRWAHLTPAIRMLLHVLKNILGCVLIVGGLAMLVLPGQGLLTLMLGFLLVDFPGKYRLERWLITRPWIHRPANWLRRRRGRQPLQVWRE
jgi:hypothetical protein